jgi:small subunit ribosomal protein S16
MVVIRLARTGAKKRPFYHVVVADQRSPRNGRNLERVGYFNPIAVGPEARVSLDLARIEYWLSCGAQPSDRIRSLIKEARKLPVPAPTAPKKVAASEISGETAEPVKAKAAKPAKATAKKALAKKTKAAEAKADTVEETPPEAEGSN